MRKTFRQFMATLLMAAMLSMPCYAQDGPGMSTLADNMGEQLKSTYAVDGNYAISRETGDIFYSEDSTTFFVNGVGKDGCVYDENGKQINTLNFVRDKYLPILESTEGDTISFDSLEELNTFICWFQLERMDHQGDSWTYSTVAQKNGETKLVVAKNLFTERAKPLSEAYYKLVDDITAQLIPGDSVSSVCTHAVNLVARTLDYDKSYTNMTMDTAIADGKGVCYHYVKILRDVLEKYGLQTEILYGNMLDGERDETHVWVRVWDEENGQWIYRDPTRASTYLASGLFTVDIYEVYAKFYRQGGIA